MWTRKETSKPNDGPWRPDRLTHLSFGVASVDVLSPPVKGCHHIQVRIVVHGQNDMFAVWQSQQDWGGLHGTHQDLVPEARTRFISEAIWSAGHKPIMLCSTSALYYMWYRETTHMSLGWHCSFKMGEGKRNRWSQSPVRTSHCETMLSVEALTSLWPSRLQLQIHSIKHEQLLHHSSWDCTQLMPQHMAKGLGSSQKKVNANIDFQWLPRYDENKPDVWTLYS